MLVIGASGFIGKRAAHFRSQLQAVGTQSQPRQAGLVAFSLLHDRIVPSVSERFFAGNGFA
jgi:hypothetical protein